MRRMRGRQAGADRLLLTPLPRHARRTAGCGRDAGAGTAPAGSGSARPGLQRRSRGHRGAAAPGGAGPGGGRVTAAVSPPHPPGPARLGPAPACHRPSPLWNQPGLENPPASAGRSAGASAVRVTKARLPFTVSARQYNILGGDVAVARACDSSLKET